MYFYQTAIAGRTVRYSLRYPLTSLYFGGEPVSFSDDTEAEKGCVSVTEKAFEEERKAFPRQAAPEHVEFKALIPATSLELLRRGSLSVFHVAAVEAEGRAWLIAAPSGGGKTTQLLNWLASGDLPEPRVISGDMPVLELAEDGTVTVHPSPWNGKEGLGGAPAAPLGGIVFLEKAAAGEPDSIRMLTPAERIEKCFGQFVCLPDTEDQIRGLAELADAVLGGYPVRLMRNGGGAGSTRLMVTALLRETGGALPRISEETCSPAGDGCYSGGIPSGGEELFVRRGGVSLHRVCGEYLLFAGREARSVCPYLSVINEPGALLWNCLSRPCGASVCAETLAGEYSGADIRLLRENAADFIAVMSRRGYLKKAEKSL